jgi:hypothetical protein
MTTNIVKFCCAKVALVAAEQLVTSVSVSVAFTVTVSGLVLFPRVCEWNSFFNQNSRNSAAVNQQLWPVAPVILLIPPFIFLPATKWLLVHTAIIKLLSRTIWRFMFEWNTRESIWFLAMSQDVISKLQQTKASNTISWQFTATRDRFLVLLLIVDIRRSSIVIYGDMRKWFTATRDDTRVLRLTAAFMQRHPLIWSSIRHQNTAITKDSYVIIRDAITEPKHKHVSGTTQETNTAMSGLTDA